MSIDYQKICRALYQEARYRDDRQWEEAVVPYWSQLSEFAAKENPAVKICIELHPGTTVYNVETFFGWVSTMDDFCRIFAPSSITQPAPAETAIA